MGIISNQLEKELTQKLSLIRLACTGLFVKVQIEPEDEPVRRELILHRAILDKALIDWFSENKEIKKDVDDWLDIRNPYFQEACERAFLKPEDVLEVFHTIKRILKGKNAKFKKVRLNVKKRRKTSKKRAKKSKSNT